MASLQLSSVSGRGFAGAAVSRRTQSFFRTSLRVPRQVVRVTAETEEKVSEEKDFSRAPVADNPYTGYIAKDSAGVTVIDVIEPSVYVSDSGPSIGETATSWAFAGAIFFAIGASAVLTTLGSNPQVGPPTLSELVSKFETELGSSSTPEVVETVVIVSEVAPALEVEIEEAPAVSEEALTVMEETLDVVEEAPVAEEN